MQIHMYVTIREMFVLNNVVKVHVGLCAQVKIIV